MTEVPFAYPDGTLVDIVRLARQEEQVWLLSFSSPTPTKPLEWIRQEATGHNCWVGDLSQQYAWVSLVGPRAHEYLACGNAAVDQLSPASTMDALIAGVAVRIFRPSKNAFAIACRPELLEKIVHSWWVGEDRPTLCGWGSYENWRLEKGVLRYGYELKEGASLYELALDNKIGLAREHFVGRNALIAQQNETLRQILVHFTLGVQRLPRANMPLYSGERHVGIVCAGGFSPALNQPIGSAWVKTEEVDFDNLSVEIRRQRYPLTIKKPPFA